MISKVWQHKTSGELYAVAVDSYDGIFGALGSLHPTDIRHVLNGEWESNERDLAYARKNEAMFRDVTLQHERARDSRLLRAAK